MEAVEYNYFETLKFNNETNILIFEIKHYSKQPKITRYVQKNYLRTPIYGDYSIRTKKVKTFKI